MNINMESRGNKAPWFEESERGGRIQITTGNAEAVAAIHQFLRFQIADHGTGDSGEIKKTP